MDQMNSQPSRRLPPDFSHTPRATFTHRGDRWNFLSSAPSLSPPSETYSPDLTFFNQPCPTVATENPVTLADAIRKMNHHLLRSCALLAHGDVDEALAEADFALYLAEARKVYHLQSKSQLYRGLALMDLKRWEEASAAFTRAASVRGWGERVAELKIEAERKMIDVENEEGEGEGN